MFKFYRRQVQDIYTNESYHSTLKLRERFSHERKATKHETNEFQSHVKCELIQNRTETPGYYCWQYDYKNSMETTEIYMYSVQGFFFISFFISFNLLTSKGRKKVTLLLLLLLLFSSKRVTEQ